MTTETILDHAHEALRRRSWNEAVDAFREAAQVRPLTPTDLEALGDAAWWAGQVDASTDALEQAYSGYIEAGEPTSAVRPAALLMQLAQRRLAMSVAAGWRAKIERLIEGQPESAIHAGLKVFDLLGLLFMGELDKAVIVADEAIELARSTGDHDIETEAMVFKGRALVGRGDWQAGIALIDEAAAAALSGSLGLRSASNIYCCTIEACRSVGDFGRAAEWTEEADRWMNRNSVGGYPGVCQIRRAELKRLRGEWPEAEIEASQACETLERYRILDEVGLGEVQLGLIRLQMGDYEGAEATFARAFEHGADPQPGLALLMLAQGKADEAAKALERSLANDYKWDLLTRMQLLPVQVHVAVVRGDLETARTAVAELEKVAAEFGRPALEASALSAKGELELAEGRPETSIEVLEKSLRLWQEIGFPFEAAQVRTLLGKTHIALGDTSRARMELNAARSTFERLGAEPGLATVDEILGSLDRQTAGKGRSTKTFMFTDIVTSTDLIGVIGDTAWEALLGWHDRELRAAFAEHGGTEVSHTGDGFFVTFEEAANAVEAAVSIQRRLADHRREHGFSPGVRIGIHTGEAVIDGADYRGQGVHLAARVSGSAGAEEIAISAVALEVAGNLRFPISEGIATQLKGIPEPVILHTVDWR